MNRAKGQNVERKLSSSSLVSSVVGVVRIKIISMGSGGVGKSCMIKRFCEEKFVPKYISTIGIDFGVKQVKVKGIEVKVNFWDLSGHPEFFEVRNEFYKDTQGALLVFDVSSRQSFEDLDLWLKESVDHGGGNFPCILCGNKVDKTRMVTETEAILWAKSKGYKYFETSAQTGVNIVEAFNYLFNQVIEETR